jgi:peptidoglycan pentaglycine glycine transferase (the first glycine)
MRNAKCVMYLMPLIEINERKSWDDFMASRPNAQFTQSWDWGEFRVSRGQTIKRYAVADERGGWLAAALFIFYSKRVCSGYWYAPRGPVLAAGARSNAGAVLRSFFESLEKIGLPKRALFWRIEPAIEDGRSADVIPAGFCRAHAYQPASTLIIDLSMDEEELISRMHEKTRYNIRLAGRKGVVVRQAKTPEDVDVFIRLNQETSRRDGFVSRPSEYIRATHDFLRARRAQGGAGGMMSTIRLAEVRGEPLAASMEVCCGDTVTYLYGASSDNKRNFMAPYALHWQAMREARASGRRFYDFHGVNPEDESSPYYKASWEGITRFKTGWGGRRVNYVGTWELPRRRLTYRAMRFFSGR